MKRALTRNDAALFHFADSEEKVAGPPPELTGDVSQLTGNAVAIEDLVASEAAAA